MHEWRLRAYVWRCEDVYLWRCEGVYVWRCEELGTMLGVRVTSIMRSLISNLHPFQVLNEFFHNVCELDLVFNFYKVNSMSVLSTLSL